MADRFPQSALHPKLPGRALEGKDYLEIDAPIGGLGSTAPAASTEKPSNGVRLVKQE